VKRTSGNLTSHEIIGLEAILVKCTQASLEGLSGTIVDETKNTVKFQANGRIKIVPKALADFRFFLPNQKVVTVCGNAIIGRPEDRIARLGKRI
jgi:ribonuclease P protein subunit POP4